MALNLIGPLAPKSGPPPTTSIRALNRARAISLVRRQPGITRAKLSRLTGLAKGTISSLVAELLVEGFLCEEGRHDLRTRNMGLRLNPDAGVAIGIELSPGECRGILTDAEIRVLRRTTRPLTSPHVEDTLEVLEDAVAELLTSIDTPPLGLAVAVPGPTDRAGQRLLYSESLGWFDVPLAARLEERLHCPVSLINRPKAGVLGEHWYGAGLGIDNLIYLSISSGVAAGILVRGELLEGENGVTGEIGHTIWKLNGPPCPCGNQGCLEVFASIPAITGAIEKRLAAGEASNLGRVYDAHRRITYDALLAAASDGDALTCEELRAAGRIIGIAAANLIGIFNPKRVIIGGHLAEAGDLVLNTIQNAARRRSYPLSYGGVEIVRSALGLDSPCIGACALVVDQYLSVVEPALRVKPARGRV